MASPTRSNSSTHHRQAQADHIGRVAVDTVDEPAAQPVEGERTGHPQRLAAGEVGRQVVSVGAGEIALW